MAERTHQWIQKWLEAEQCSSSCSCDCSCDVIVLVVVVGRNKDWGPVENNNFLTLGILWCSLRAFTQVPAVLKNNFGGDNPHVFDSDV